MERDIGKCDFCAEYGELVPVRSKSTRGYKRKLYLCLRCKIDNGYETYQKGN